MTRFLYFILKKCFILLLRGKRAAHIFIHQSLSVWAAAESLLTAYLSQTEDEI